MLRAVCILICAGVAALAGCGGSSETRDEFTVTGKVTFQNQPVTEGTVQFEDAATGLGGSAEISPEGTYEATLAAGTYLVAILPPTEITPGTPDSPGGVTVKDVKNIPEKFRAFDTSSLSAIVSADKLEHSFDMTP
jgi:hypothetical protein